MSSPSTPWALITNLESHVPGSTRYQLGLGPADYVGAFTYGVDAFINPRPDGWIVVTFSVSPGSAGLPGTAVADQVALNGAAGADYFQAEVFGDGTLRRATYVPIGGGFLNHGLLLSSNIDGMSRPLVNFGSNIYGCLAGGSSILLQRNPGPFPAPGFFLPVKWRWA